MRESPQSAECDKIDRRHTGAATSGSPMLGARLDEQAAHTGGPPGRMQDHTSSSESTSPPPERPANPPSRPSAGGVEGGEGVTPAAERPGDAPSSPMSAFSKVSSLYLSSCFVPHLAGSW